MRSDEFFHYLLSQLANRAPLIITFLVGVVLSLIFWGRRPRQSMLVMLASIIALVTSVGYALAFSYIVSDEYSSRHTELNVLSVISSVLTVVPYALLFCAALSGPREQRAFPVQMPPPPLPYRR